MKTTRIATSDCELTQRVVVTTILLHQKIRQRADDAMSSSQSPADVTITGLWPLSVLGRKQLYSNLISSFVMAFVIIAPVIMLIRRSLWVGVIAMIPNLLPSVFLFGIIGWLNIEIGIGAILTAIVGLGIAVGDTLHFLEVYCRERKLSHNREGAVYETVLQCSRPMLNTTLICSAGLAVFAACQFGPGRQFSIAIVILLGLALMSDLLILPGLMLGPLGNFFETKSKTTFSWMSNLQGTIGFQALATKANSLKAFVNR